MIDVLANDSLLDMTDHENISYIKNGNFKLDEICEEKHLGTYMDLI